MGTEDFSAAAPTADGIFDKILQVAADAIVTVDEEQRIVHFNRGAEAIFGYESSEVLGSPLALLLPARFRESHVTHVQTFGYSAETARLMGHRREVFGLRKDGSEFPAEASILKLDAPDGRRLYTAVVRDVTDRKRMDQQQRFLAEVSATMARSLEYADTLESVVRLPVPALADACILDVLDESGKLRRIAYAPDALADLFAKIERFASPLDATAARVAALDKGRTHIVANVSEQWLAEHFDDPAEAELMRSVGARTLLILPLVARSQPIGVMTLVSVEAARRFDASDVVVADNFAGRAALAIVNARLYRDAQRATRARDEVLGVVSHDLRNPLSAIAMCSRVLMDTPPANADARQELAKSIYDATTWMSRMIQDLLDVSAIEAGVLSLVCADEMLAPILTRAADLFVRAASERGVGLHTRVADAGLTVYADAERLVQAVANLIGNALKFTAPAGSIEVTASSSDCGIEISVKDTGRGITANDLPHIFDRYWHTHGAEAGTGLGLAIAKGIAEAHDGQIVVASTPGIGSCFSLSIPHRRMRL
jgi:PAS domain S-box-containing protein